MIPPPAVSGGLGPVVVVVDAGAGVDSAEPSVVEDAAGTAVLVVDVPAVPPHAASISATTPSEIRRLITPGYGRGPRTRHIHDATADTCRKSVNRSRTTTAVAPAGRPPGNSTTSAVTRLSVTKCATASAVSS